MTKCGIIETADITILGLQFIVEVWSDGKIIFTVFKNGWIQESRTFSRIQEVLNRQSYLLGCEMNKV